jgi:putative hemolysin
MVRIALILFFSSFAYSGDADNIILTVEGKKIVLIDSSEKSLTISENCKNLKCKAYEAFLKKNSVTLLPDEISGGRNPGTAKCRKLGGIVQIGVDEERNEMSVCTFTDGSAIDCGSF